MKNTTETPAFITTYRMPTSPEHSHYVSRCSCGFESRPCASEFGAAETSDYHNYKVHEGRAKVNYDAVI